MTATIPSVDETGAAITIPNPPVAADEADRAVAQAIVDATPAAVKAF